MQNLDLGLTHKTGGAYHNINDLFLEFFHFDEKKPSQGQNTDFCRFEHSGFRFDMFEWVKWLVLWNLSLIYIIMMICEKKIDTFSTEIAPTATIMVIFRLKKAHLCTGT